MRARMRPGPKLGVLLINVGTPDAPRAAEVRRYLREFLSDPRILDISAVGRWLLLNLIILPFRPRRSALAYRSVWLPEGSPLMHYSRRLVEALRAAMPEADIELGMRYGEPSLERGLDALRARGCDRIVAVPLYPQYAASTTGSSVEALYRAAGEPWNTPFLTVVPPFYDHPDFIDAVARVGAPVLEDFRPDHVMFSFHGVPERHVRKSDPSGMHCLVQPGCCDAIGPTNRNCYRAHCVATAGALRDRLGLKLEDTTISFQSRLGRTPWIKPFTDDEIVALARRGVRRLAVFCPAFVADCLETLEEIGIRAAESFTAAGGEALRLVPCLNDHPVWVRALATIIRESTPHPRALPVVGAASPAA
jgi:ferrochelatase